MKTRLLVPCLCCLLHAAMAQTIHDVNGKVGIGTASPQSILDVHGNIQLSNADIPMGLMTELGGTTPLLNLSMNFREPNRNNSLLGAAIRIDGRSDPAYPLFQFLRRFPGSSQEDVLLAVNANGNVGIGAMDTKGYKLAVAGSMIAESVKVKLRTAWPDYVFAPGYRLPSLQEVERYIQENGHLPEMPAADEVEKEGIDVGEMNRRLVEKVEELMLYLIELKKEIEMLKKKDY